MNNKGFTLMELLATIIVLSIVLGIVVSSVGGLFSNAKNKTEDVFVETIKDALDVYLDSDAKALDFSLKCTESLYKTHGVVNVYKATTITFKTVIDSKYKPISEEDFVNPSNEEIDCNVNASVTIYRDDDYVYYYSVDKSSFGCLTNSGFITNLPILDSGDYYTCGL